jgi:hypothetical protein
MIGVSKQPLRMTKFEQEVERRNNERLRNRLLAKCRRDDATGAMVRGYVDRVVCHCGAQRWDDGTPCSQCGRRLYRNDGDEDGGTQS